LLVGLAHWLGGIPITGERNGQDVKLVYTQLGNTMTEAAALAVSWQTTYHGARFTDMLFSSQLEIIRFLFRTPVQKYKPFKSVT
jgi:hypothetical protein